LRILLLMSLKCFCLCLLLCFIGVGSNSPSEGFLDIASRIVYQADTLQPNSHYRNVIHAHREDSENGLRLKLRVIETVCSTERAILANDDCKLAKAVLRQQACCRQEDKKLTFVCLEQ
ncbi:hypothetical protein T09_5545, partial [Trichinella sp. T9]